MKVKPLSVKDLRPGMVVYMSELRPSEESLEFDNIDTAGVIVEYAGQLGFAFLRVNGSAAHEGMMYVNLVGEEDTDLYATQEDAILAAIAEDRPYHEEWLAAADSYARRLESRQRQPDDR